MSCELCGRSDTPTCGHVSDGLPSDDFCPSCGRCFRDECLAKTAYAVGVERLAVALPGCHVELSYGDGWARVEVNGRVVELVEPADSAAEAIREVTRIVVARAAEEDAEEAVAA